MNSTSNPKASLNDRGGPFSNGDFTQAVMSNVRFDHSSPDDDALQEYMKSGVLSRELIIERGGIRFGLMGLMGSDAAEVAKDTAPLTFDKNTETANRIALMLKTRHKVDVVIALSHGGVQKQADGTWKGEDLLLADAAPELDIVVGGHSHTTLEKPLTSESGKPVLQAGSDGRFLGELELEITPTGIQIVSYRLHPIDDSIAGKPEITALIESVKAKVSEKILAPRGLTLTSPLHRPPEPWREASPTTVLATWSPMRFV